MTMRVSKSRIDMDDKVLQKPVLKDYGESLVTANTGSSYIINPTSSDSGIVFDGSNDVVTIGNVSAMQITGDQTIAMWVRPDNFSARRNPYAKAYGGEGTITQETNGTLNYFYGTAGANSSPYQGFNSSTTLTVREWSHIAIVRDLTNNILRWYINGVETSSAAASYSSATASSLSAFIGDGYTNNYAGIIKDVRVYSRALSESEVDDLYNGLAVSSTNLAGHWKLDEGSGTSANDSSTNNNDGTVSGSPVWVQSTSGNVFDLTLTSNCTFSFVPPDAARACTFTLKLTQDSTGGRSVTWPASVKWSGGSAPSLGTTAGDQSFLSFITTDGGANWYGFPGDTYNLSQTFFLTSGSSWTVPSGWNSSNNTIEVIGGGGSGETDTGNQGFGGGGGGGYSKSVNVSLTPGSTVTYSIGSGGTNGGAGGDTYICNSTSNCSSIGGSAVVCGAKGGAAGSSRNGGAGGAAGSGVGNTRYSGGTGGYSGSWGGGGGGGAAGPNGNGGTGGRCNNQGGAGGGGNGGGATGGTASSANGANGGNNYAGTGAGSGGTSGVAATAGSAGGGGGGVRGSSGCVSNAGAGGAGNEWDASHGSGGGGGGGGDNNTGYGPNKGGLYGGGGGGAGADTNSSGDESGAQGIIVITYTHS